MCLTTFNTYFISYGKQNTQKLNNDSYNAKSFNSKQTRDLLVKNCVKQLMGCFKTENKFLQHLYITTDQTAKVFTVLEKKQTICCTMVKTAV